MALLAPQVVALSGLTPTYTAAAASTTVTCGERSFLHVKNAAGSSMTVTITATGKIRGQGVADLVVTVPATTGDKMIGPLTPDLFASAADGVSAAITYSSTTSVTVANITI
ncbi:hypothetical protein OOK06_36535 [Streptomyces sp. NBC_00340]|jgi:hypothetical protein|uniref:hypothetical protein n=1 Tax=Streptomyces sp. NBC_00340 TaxID=2975716 RepID=UPI002257CA39|nr:hypothetical protein [Streptomyces sp. NBC_00340]MCX5137578.1 hypothetical protein [Streptomyces sp. NBC_00340]